MKFLLFADFHYAPGIFMGGTPEALASFQRRAEEAGCEFIIHLGDLCNCREEHRFLIDAYNEFHIPSYHVLGNHDADVVSHRETLAFYHLERSYYYFDRGGYRLIVLDPNYYLHDGEYVAYEHCNYFKHGPERDWLPPEQLAWLDRTIEEADGPCLIFSHESFERPDGVKNRDEVRAIINAANRRRPHSVLACFNGHYHRDHHEVIDGVLYMEVNATTYDWLERRHDLFPRELCEGIIALDHTVVYEDPLSAVVTVEGTAVTVEGRESRMLLGVTRERAGCRPLDGAGRPVVPRITSFSVKL